MNKKGFTLIELLVVIVILAIIALITVPNALAMISTSQTRADARSVEGVRRAVEVICLKARTSVPVATPVYDLAAVNAELKTPVHAVASIAADASCNVTAGTVTLRSGGTAQNL